VTTDGVSFDTLNVGQEAFRLFAMSPDRRRLAAVVGGLQIGEHHLLWRRTKVRQPVWSPRGDRFIFTAGDSVFLAYADGSAPEFVATGRNSFEVFSWSRENRVVGGEWYGYQAISLDPTTQPVTWDTIASGVEFPVLSPDGRWLAYTDVGGSNVYLAPAPGSEKRYLVAPGWEPLWLSSRELAYATSATTMARASIDVSGGVPVFTKRAWATLLEWVGTSGQSAQLTPANRILYSRGARPEPRRYLRVVPDWVRQMKRKVDEAND
jgi:Tol biopolymer transport system component